MTCYVAATLAEKEIRTWVNANVRRKDLDSVQMLDGRRARVTLRDGSNFVLTWTRQAVRRTYIDDTI